MTFSPESTLLTDRVGVVTGAAVGIGAASAIALARFGAHVAICDRDRTNLDLVAAEIEKLRALPTKGLPQTIVVGPIGNAV